MTSVWEESTHEDSDYIAYMNTALARLRLPRESSSAYPIVSNVDYV